MVVQEPMGSSVAPERAPGSASAGGPVRIAAIDVGSNSVRLIVAEVQADGSYRVIDDERALARLGAELATTNLLPEASMALAITALTRMRSIAEGFRVARLRCIATSAVREASNGPEFVARVRDAVGIEVEVIDADQEARLAFRSIAAEFDLRDHLVAAMDIGGGSAQLVLAAHGVVEGVHPFALGAVRLAVRFTQGSRIAEREFEKLREHVRSHLQAGLGELPFQPDLLIGTGGTFTTLGLMHAMARDGKVDSPPVQGLELRRADVRHLLDRLRQMSLDERRRFRGLPADRADIIVPGLCVVDEALGVLGVNRVRIHAGGVRDGLVQAMVRELVGDGAGRRVGGSDPMGSARRFARRCGYDAEHAEHTALLAGQIFDALVPLLPERTRGLMTAEARQMLLAASVLHDVGYLVNYDSHHKHSYHLVANADLEGWTRRQIECVANVARYHRKSEPKMSHKPFAGLSAGDRELVRLLSGILRVAVGLNRTRTRVVRGVSAKQAGDGGVELIIESAGPCDAELWAAERKLDVLAEALGVGVRVAGVDGSRASEAQDNGRDARAGD